MHPEAHNLFRIPTDGVSGLGVYGGPLNPKPVGRRSKRSWRWTHSNSSRMPSSTSTRSDHWGAPPNPPPETLHPKPSTRNPPPYILHPPPRTTHLIPQTPITQTPCPKPHVPDPKPQTPYPVPQTPNPKPQHRLVPLSSFEGFQQSRDSFDFLEGPHTRAFWLFYKFYCFLHFPAIYLVRSSHRSSPWISQPKTH